MTSDSAAECRRILAAFDPNADDSEGLTHMGVGAYVIDDALNSAAAELVSMSGELEAIRAVLDEKFDGGVPASLSLVDALKQALDVEYYRGVQSGSRKELNDLKAWTYRELDVAQQRFVEAERNSRDETAANENERVATLCDVLTRLGEDAPDCLACRDMGEVCENHPDRPWEGWLSPGESPCCGGAGMPCQRCDASTYGRSSRG